MTVRKIVTNIIKEIPLDLAACAGMDTEVFFDEDKTSDNYKLAVDTCTGCPVALQCLVFAVQNKEHGVWGGSNFEERAKMHTRQKVVDFVVKLQRNA